MGLKFSVILILSAGLTWWLSGYDSQVTGENHVADIKRRTVRCVVTLIVLALGVSGSMGGGRFGGFVSIATVLPLALMWTGCLSELLSRGVHSLIDSPDPREVDKQHLTRELDRLAALVQQGRNHEAIELCAKLRESAEGSALALEAMLSRVYDEMFAEHFLPTCPRLLEARALFEEGCFEEAESKLNQVLNQEPGNLAAAVLLMRLYVQELRRPGKAHALLQSLERRCELPPGFADYSRQRIGRWLTPRSKVAETTEGIESLLVESKHVNTQTSSAVWPEASVEGLLSSGHLGTAIEILEKQSKERPEDFDCWFKLAEAYGFYCCNISRAKEIVRKIEAKGTFTAEQVRQAKANLQQWQARQPNRAF